MPIYRDMIVDGWICTSCGDHEEWDGGIFLQSNAFVMCCPEPRILWSVERVPTLADVPSDHLEYRREHGLPLLWNGQE